MTEQSTPRPRTRQTASPGCSKTPAPRSRESSLERRGAGSCRRRLWKSTARKTEPSKELPSSEAHPGQGGTQPATGTPRPSPAPTIHPVHPLRQSREELHPPRPQRRRNRLQPRGAQRVKQEANRRRETSRPPAPRRRAGEPRKYDYDLPQHDQAPTRLRRPILRASRAREAAVSTKWQARAPNQGGSG